MTDKKCLKCGYTWTPKVAEPKMCPRCHAYLKPQEKRVSVEKPSENVPIHATTLIYCPFCGAKLPVFGHLQTEIMSIPLENEPSEEPSEEEPTKEEPTEKPIEEEPEKKPRKKKEREPKITDPFESSGFSEPFESSGLSEPFEPSEGFREALGLPPRPKEKQKKKVI